MDGLLTEKKEGKRQWLYPLIRRGTLYKWRSWLSYFYLIIFFSGPFIRINGEPLLLLNFLDRQFVLAGQVFWPQDIFLFALASLIFIVCIVLFTIAFGRVFCGWVCPQTIFMEMVFRKIEVWIEGSPANRKKLDNAPWTKDKILKKTGKHTAFIFISFLISNTFLAYIIGSGALLKIVAEPVSEHLIGFGSICAFTIIFYAVYSQIREQVCTLFCPYGRLQGVMIDKHTVVVAYDDVRGEPRGKLERNPDPLNAKGDCVDCKLCVEVCPTGIDIRNGTQMECVNCTACIDACNEVMIKINRPINLIGFYSESMIRTKEKFSFSGRMIAYSSVIAVLIGVLCYFIFSRTDIDITLMRSAGTLYQEQPGGKISNIYNAEIINKTNKTQFVKLEPEDPAVTIKYIQAPGNIAHGESAKTIFFVIIPASSIHTLKTDIRLRLVSGHKIIQTVSTTFLGPIND